MAAGLFALAAAMAGAQIAPRRPSARFEPLPPERVDVLVFCSDRDGGNEVNLTDHGANDTGLAWRPVVPPEERWARTFGGPALDRPKSVQQTTDGGFVIGGRTESFGAGREDAWLILTDEEGNEIWSRTYGGPWDDDIYAVLVGDDGGYVLCGHRGTGDHEFDMWIAKVDEAGTMAWEQSFGGPGWDNAYSCIATRDGDYVLAGYTESTADDLDVWLIKTDRQGHRLWDSVFRGTGRDTAFTIRETRDGGFIVGGFTYSFGEGGGDGYIVRLNREQPPRGLAAVRKDAREKLR